LEITLISEIANFYNYKIQEIMFQRYINDYMIESGT